MNNIIANILGRSAIYGESAEQATAAFLARVQSDGGVVEGEDYLTEEIQRLKDLGIWDKLSAAWIPSGYAEGKLYAVKGGTEADFGFTRAGTRTRVSHNGLIEEVPYNLLRDSENFNTGSWALSSVVVQNDGTTTPSGSEAFKLVPNSNTGFHFIYQASAATTKSGLITIAAWAKAGEYNGIEIAYNGNPGAYAKFDLKTGTTGTVSLGESRITSVGNGWYKCEFISDATQLLNIQFRVLNENNLSNFEGDGESGVYLWKTLASFGSESRDAIRTTNRQNVPAIDFTGGTPKLSLQPGRTNLLKSSQAFSSADWTKSGSNITGNLVEGPDGLIGAEEINITTTTAALYQNVAITPNSVYTLSWYAKRGTSPGFSYRVYDITNAVDIIPPTNYFEQTSNEWVRIVATFTTPVGCNNIAIRLLNNSNQLGTVYLTKAQLEQGSYATSYIPTGTSTASRIVDSPNPILNAEAFIGHEEGTFFVDFSSYTDGSGKQIYISDGTPSNRIGIAITTSHRLQCTAVSNGTSSSIVFGEITSETRYKTAITYVNGYIAFFVNGVKLGQASSFVVPSGLTQIRFDNGFGSANFYGHVYGKSISKKRISDEEAIALTTL